MRKILEKCTIERALSGVLTKGRYKGKEVSVFRTGKLILARARATLKLKK